MTQPESIFNTTDCTIRGADGEWYEVPQPVLVQFMVSLGMSSAGARKLAPRLVRPGEATLDDQVTLASDGNFALLATDELLAQVTAYLESGDLDRLLDIRELCETLATIRGVGAGELLRREHQRTHHLGSYKARTVFHPPQEES